MSRIYSRKTIFEELNAYCLMSRKGDFIEVTEWKNGEGFDVAISSKWSERIVQMTWGEFELLRKLVSVLNNE